jgi:hypothetical protein
MGKFTKHVPTGMLKIHGSVEQTRSGLRYAKLCRTGDWPAENSWHPVDLCLLPRDGRSFSIKRVQRAMKTEGQAMNKLFSWFWKNRSDLLGLAGFVVGILGIGSGYLFYRASLPNPGLSLFDGGAHPRLINVSAVANSPIKLVRRNGSAVMKNVYLAKLYVWNSGNVVLEQKDILKALKITADGVEILDPKINIVHRPDITGLSVTQDDEKSLNLDFKLLEPCATNLIIGTI